jgi:hypothetical protein
VTQHLILENNAHTDIVGFHVLFDDSFHILNNENEVRRTSTARTSEPLKLIYVASHFEKLELVLTYARIHPEAKIILFLERTVTAELIKKFKNKIDQCAVSITGVFTTNGKLQERIKHILAAPIFELQEPIDLEKIKQINQERKKELLAITSNHAPTRSLPCELLVITKDSTEDEKNEIIETISAAKFILILDDQLSGEWIEIAAALGCIVIGPSIHDEIFYLFPYTHTAAREQEFYINQYSWISKNAELVEFLSELSKNKIQRANRFNSQERIKAIAKAHLETELFFDKNRTSYRSLIFSEKIISTKKPEEVSLSTGDLAICCLVKDGVKYAPLWLSHYRKMGAKKIFIVDNGSSDGTLEFFNSQRDVFLFKTDLDFCYFESEIRQYIIENYCQKTWCLSVDIDEFFEYPKAHQHPFNHFIDYLNFHNYTAVIATMVDMLPRSVTQNGENYIETNILYDLSNVKNSNYEDLRFRHYKYNICARKDLQFFYGGVRAHNFMDSSEPKPVLLLKHPLTFQDGKLIPQIDPHFCDRARIADVSCALLHYKLAEFNKGLTLARAKAKVFNYYANLEYQNYLDCNTEYGEIYYSSAPQELRSTEELSDTGIMQVSPQYIRHVHRFKQPH